MDGEGERKVERAGSFKSDFMRRCFSPVSRAGDAPDEQLAVVLSRRQEEVKGNRELAHDDSDSREDKRQARAERFKPAEIEQVIVDSEVAAVLKARRKETDSAGLDNIDRSLYELARVTSEVKVGKESSPETQATALAPVSYTSNRKLSQESLKEVEQFNAGVQERISTSLHLCDTSAAHVPELRDKESSPNNDTLTITVRLDEAHSGHKMITETYCPNKPRDHQAQDMSIKLQESSTVISKVSTVLSEGAVLENEIKGCSQEGTDVAEVCSEKTYTVVLTPRPTASLHSDSHSLRRTASLKESPVKRSESFERRKGILKQTASSRHQDVPIVDPQLARIMEQRRQKVEELETAKEEDEAEGASVKVSTRPRALSAAKEIEENVRRMRESQQCKSTDAEQLQEESELCMSVTERIVKMQSKIEEMPTSCTPQSRSGAVTPQSARSWSGGHMPRKQISMDEGVSVAIAEESPVFAFNMTVGGTRNNNNTVSVDSDSAVPTQMSGPQLMDRLHILATNSAQFEERRHRFQKRQRDDWRTRTQPVTLEEIHQADRLSLAEKVKLFSDKSQQEKEAASVKPPPRTDIPVRRRQRKLQPTRFNTQPVTPEELEKASRISPLAMSLVKPPDPELLVGLKLKDVQELMMLHAEATLSQCSSRAGSRSSSQPGSRRGSFTTADTLPSAATGSNESTINTLPKSNTETAETSKMSSTGSESTDATKSCFELTRHDSGEPRGILKKGRSEDSMSGESASITATLAGQGPDSDAAIRLRQEDSVSPVPDLILPTNGSTAPVIFMLSEDDLAGESTTDPEPSEETTARLSRRERVKTQPDRYLTQPTVCVTPEKSPQTKRKYEGRHMTQPITPDEMKEAESVTNSTPSSKVTGGSIADRLNQLKTSGEESWKRRVPKEKEFEAGAPEIDLRDKPSLAAVRPISISDRLSKLGKSGEQWKARVEETDAHSFTVANKLSRTGSLKGSESPLVARIKASSKKDLTKLDDSSTGSTPVSSPSTPTKEFLPKVPLPTEIVSDPDAVRKNEEVKAKQQEDGSSEKREIVSVLVPSLDQKEIEEFFATKQITEITEKVAVDVDDFNNIFIEANEMLQSVRKIRAKRKTKASSHNPLRTQSQFVEIKTEYTQINTGVAEKHMRQLKTEELKREAGFALEALAGLASKENFSKVELRKTELSSLPAALATRQNPFSDLMLLHIKGRRNIQTRLLEPSSKSINSGDCYILVTPDKVINWVGEYSNIIEKAKAAEVAIIIQQKRDLGYKGTAPVQTVDQLKDHLGSGKHFWAALQGDKECQDCGPEEEDELYESSIIKTNMVYRLIDGALQPYQQYWGTAPKHEMLAATEVLVFDFGSEYYVWQGKAVSSEERKRGMVLSQKLWSKGYDYSQCAVNPMGPLRSEEQGGIPTKAAQRPSWAIFGKVNQNMETILFREKFADWPDTSRLIAVKGRKSAELKNEFADMKAFDAKKMIPVTNAPVTMVLEGAHVGRGKKWEEDMQGFIKEQEILTLGVKVWHVLEYDHYLVHKASYGQFHRGDTYVVRWQYMITNAGLKSLKGQATRQSLTGRERCAYFFWQGQNSTINEKGASALMTVELDEERGPQVRVVQGKEPPCFLNLFEGSMVVHIGKREDASTNTQGSWRMYCVRGDKAGEVCLLEIKACMPNLRSRSSLVLINTKTGMTYVWHGIKSPTHKRQLALHTASMLKQKQPLELDLNENAHMIITEVAEGEEPSEIWSALDSRDRSLYHSLLNDTGCYEYTPRLFYMTSVSTVFEVTEQLNPARVPGMYSPFPFFQSDLYKASQPALFLLDMGHCIYLWQGWWPVGDEDVENVHTGSATARFNSDRLCAMETTLNYCKERGHGDRIPEAYLVCAGVEPLSFCNLFPYWESDDTVISLAEQDGKHQGYCEKVQEVYTKLTQTQYSLDELQERPLPDGVDPLKLESYLPDDEFEAVLELKREEFYALPTWKQIQLKQSLGLY